MIISTYTCVYIHDYTLYTCHGVIMIYGKYKLAYCIYIYIFIHTYACVSGCSPGPTNV